MSDLPGGPGEPPEVGISVRVQGMLTKELVGFEVDLQAWRHEHQPRKLNHPGWRLSLCKQNLIRADRSDGVLIVEELQSLLAVAVQSDSGEFDELVQMLLDLTAAFKALLPSMRARSELACIMTILSLLNDCRACRGKELLSAAVVDAVGIPSVDLRRQRADAVFSPEHWQAFQDRVRKHRSDVQHAILKWFGMSWRKSTLETVGLHPLQQLRGAFDSMGRFDFMGRNESTAIDASAWKDLLAAVEIVLDSIVTGNRSDGVAVRRLFAQLERCLAEVTSGEAHQPPQYLLQDLLWYVVESGGESASILELNERLGLERLGLERLVGLEGNIQARPGDIPVFFPDRRNLLRTSSAVLPENSSSDAEQKQCRESVRALRLQLLDALVLGGQKCKELPDEAMLRSLQSLNLSLQTIAAEEMRARLAPLHKRALLRQRESQVLDAREIREFSLFLQRLESALGPDLAVSSKEGDDFTDSSDDSLREVFDEEAHHLVECMYELLEGRSEMSAALRIAGVLAHLHTLKGSARMAQRQSIAEHAHVLEGEVQSLGVDSQLMRLRQGRIQLQTLILNDQAERQLGSTSQRTTLSSGDRAASSLEGLLETGYDEMLRSTTVMGVSLARLGEHLQRFDDVAQDLESTALQWRRMLDESERPRSTAELELLNDLEAAREHLSNGLQHAGMEQRSGSRSSARMQQNLIRSRRMSADQLRDRLQRVLDDADESGEAQLQLLVEGGQTMLDRGLFRQLLPILEHLIRNARIHGIESMSERLALGKSAMGEVRLSIQQDGVELIVSVCDDGRGVDSQAINAERALRGESALETAAELQAELCKTGFTTLSDSSLLAGRGLGLSAVRQLVEQLKGRLGLWTRPGQGTRVTLTVPQAVAINPSVLVRAGSRLYALPAERVRWIEPGEGGADLPAKSVEAEQTLVLERLLGVDPVLQASSESVQKQYASFSLMNGQYLPESPRRIHVEFEGTRLVIEVPEILGHRELIAQPLGHQLATLKRFTGGSVLPDGRQVLMLDLERLLKSACASADVNERRSRVQHSASTALVVDDSLTMRVAASRYLEARGVSVSTARDGVEALAMMGISVPSLLIVDIDMPKLDGFELLSRLQRLLSEKLPPVIVISSRGRSEDRKRAQALGVDEFLVKPWNNDEMRDALVAVGVRLPDITIA